jgi:acetyl-CoA carboxylase biotin carboxylase subunit
MFSRILIANRGEIALRVIRACKELGIETVAVYSLADRDAAYLRLADESVCIGPEAASESYLNPARLIAAAEISNAQAIHPGYGFLSEKADFAEMCADHKLAFIGPNPAAMRKLGDKVEAKKIAKAAKVPTVPGYDQPIEDVEAAVAVARSLGFPVIIKAAAGGGGRGMRVAADEHAFRTLLPQAQSEAAAAFKDPSVYLEKLIERPRHVEVQLLGDAHGNVVHLWERDCSTQRRHQKLIEESPSPRLPEHVRRSLCEAAVRLAREAGYHNAGTCEFLVDQQDNFYFIEVNARIQVEHPVTELVTGVDLIQQQIRVAAGEPLPFKQEDIVHRGAAIECRINAEDPINNFRPCPGRIDTYIAPGGPGVRLDTVAHQGYTITPKYDSMIGKLLVHRPTRAEAIATMLRALAEFRIDPIKTTIPFFRRLMAHPAFAEGQMDTTYVEREFLKEMAGKW